MPEENNLFHYQHRHQYYTGGVGLGYLWKVIKDSGGLNNTNEYEYDVVGNIIGLKDAKGNKTTFLVNPLNQVTETLSRPPFNYRVKFYYDANDNLERTEVQNIDENGVIDPYMPWISTSYNYDILDNLKTKTEQVSATESAETGYNRDANENLIETIEPELNKRQVSYDERDLVYKETQGAGTPEALETRSYYDPNANLIRTEIGDGAKGTVTHEYDGFDRRIKTTDALGNYTLTKYDANGNVTRTASYDKAGQKLSGDAIFL